MFKGIMLCAVGAVALAATPAQAATYLVVAGGGGGAGGVSNATGGNGEAGTAGGSGADRAPGGTAGAGGGGGYRGGGGGAGISSGGSTNVYSGGGGVSGPDYAGGSGNFDGSVGGFGGGGGASIGGGGGGGYSGGGGGSYNPYNYDYAGYGVGGGGGGSYLDASLVAIAGLPSLNQGVSSQYSAGANGFITIFNDQPGPGEFVATTFGYTGGIQYYTFATSGTYAIVAAGGQGGSSTARGGLGARIGGQGVFSAGTTLSLVVGGGGGHNVNSNGSGGGGGSFVFLTSTPVAGVPEPASWATMIAGFGLIGGAMRRRKLRADFA